MAAARAGDDRAFEQLYGRYQRRIAAYVHGMVKDYGRSEDITQEVFMSALRRMRETERPIAFKPWIYEIAKNACIDAFRRSRRTDEVSFDADDGLGAGDHLKLVSRGQTPDAAIDTRMALDDLRGAFGGLSDAHHDILVMRELEGRSYREIGERLGMSRSSVESTLFRARRRLSEEYQELVSGKRCEQFQELIAQAADVRLGARDERKMARHVSHCQPCRRAAGLAGLDVATMAQGRGMRAKIAALLPLPAFLKRRWLPGAEGDGGTGGSLGSWSSMAAQYAEPMSGWAKAATVAATVALAGAGAGLATSQGDSDPGARAPASAAPAAATQGGGPVSTAGADRPSGARGGTTTQRRSSERSSGADKPSSAASRTGAPAAGKADRGSGGSVSSGGSAGSGGGGAGTVADRASGAAGDAVKTTVPKVVGGATGAVDHVTTTTGKVLDRTAGQATNTADSTSGAATDTVTGTVTGVTETATDALPRTTSTVTGTLDKTTNGATSGASGTVEQAAQTVAGAAQGAGGTATGAVDSTGGTATGAVNTTTNTATGAADGLLGGQ